MSESTPAAVPPVPPDSSAPGVKPPRQPYVRAVGPRLRILLYVLFLLVALLGANAAYLSTITFVEWYSARWGDKATYQNYFYQCMFLMHLALGLLLILPLVVFGTIHMITSRNRKNKRAIRVGYLLFAASLVVLISGLALMRIGGFDLKQPLARNVVYWLHFAAPLVAGWLYWLHRLVGPKIKWKIGISYSLATAVLVAGMVGMHSLDPRKWNQQGPASKEYFEPSLARTVTGKFIPAKVMQMDSYCLKCHKDAYDGWYHSVHHISSFNNPAYLASVRETREVAYKRDGSVQASRWCAGCHDPVPFLSGAFDDPKFDDVNHPTAQAGITCTVCHAVTHVNSPKGNADYTIDEPTHYPFAQSENVFLQFVNEQLVKAKPEFHKKTFLKDFHKSAEFCSTCHKVHIPMALNKYKDFLRGQNHYDTYLLSGVSGHGIRSFYYPEKAEKNCAGCHMPLKESGDFGARLFDDSSKLKIHNHLFPAANTGIAWMRDEPEVIAAHEEFLKEKLRVDIFGLKEGGAIDGKLLAPLRPNLPRLKPGQNYLLETVVRTLKLGHPFSQGTVDSNEIWLEVTLTSGGKVIGKSGGIDAQREVDPWSHFINVFMLDRNGNRIDRRNPQDIFVPLYNHQIPPGAGQVAHYGFQVPQETREPVTIEVKLQYRKFDKTFSDYFTSKSKPGDNPIRGHSPGKPYLNELPVTTMAVDRLTLPVEGSTATVAAAESKIPPWQRWNDYGIGLFLEGKAELRQAADAFAEVEKLKRFDGPLNLARVYVAEGRLDEAVLAVNRAAEYKDPPAPRWTLAWLSGVINRQQGHFEEAAADLRSALSEKVPEKGFDFSLDYEVINLLAATLFDLGKQELSGSDKQKELLKEAAAMYLKTINIDPENFTAHYGLQQVYDRLGDKQQAADHEQKHLRYKPDDNARDRAVALARKKYPAANGAAEALVIYALQRRGAPGLDVASVGEKKPVEAAGGGN